MMKNFTSKCLVLLALVLMVTSMNLQAQEANSESAVTIIQKITAEDGKTVVKKKRFQKGEDVDAYIKALELDNINNENVEIDVNVEDGQHTIIINSDESKDDNTVLYMRRSKSDCDSNDGPDNVHIIIDGEKIDVNDEDYQWDDKAFSEKFAKKYSEKYNYSNNDWSKKYDYNNNNWNNQHHWNNGHRWNNDEYKEVTKPLLGVYLEDNETEPGILLSGVTSKGGAKAAGLERGDVILSINGTSLDNVYDLRNELGKNAPGDAVNLVYTRNGATYNTTSILGEKTSYERQRDPCRPFIGVVIGDYSYNEKGVRVQRIVPNTSAEEANLLAGDYILAIDDMPTHTHGAVVKERDKHEAGDYYTLTINRNGQIMDVDAQFGPCENEQPARTETPTEATEEEITELAPSIEEAPELMINNTLDVQDFSSYPNPTYGEINVRFKAATAPTTIQISDLTGKVIYQEVINNFDGFYQKQLNIGNATPGTMNLTVRQGEKIYTKRFVLVARA